MEYELKFVGPLVEQLLSQIKDTTQKGLYEIFHITQYYLPSGERLRYSLDQTTQAHHYVLAAPKIESLDGGNSESEQDLSPQEFDKYLNNNPTDLVIKKERTTIPLIIDNKRFVVDSSCKDIQSSLVRCDIDRFTDIEGLSRAEIETNNQAIFVQIQEVLKRYQKYHNIVMLPKQLTNKTLAKIQVMGGTQEFLKKLNAYIQKPSKNKLQKELVEFLEQSKKEYSMQCVR